MYLPVEMKRQTEAAFERAGFASDGLSEILDRYPGISYVEDTQGRRTPYRMYGSLDAPYQVLEGTPHFTEVDADHFMLRQAAKQEVAGPEFNIISIGLFTPRTLDYDRRERKQIKSGNFTPAADRMARVAAKVGVDEVILSGQSRAADVAIQLGYNTVTDESRGTLAVRGLGAWDYARSEDRGAIGVTKAMNSSGGEFYDNVWAANSLPLLEAWGLDPNVPKEDQRKAFDKQVGSGIAKYVLQSVRSNVAWARGFGTSESERQIPELVKSGIYTLIGRQSLSTVCTKDSVNRLRFEGYGNTPYFANVESGGDHSDDDNIRRAAYRFLLFTTLLKRHTHYFG